MHAMIRFEAYSRGFRRLGVSLEVRELSSQGDPALGII
jgi:hypothetical protein